MTRTASPLPGESSLRPSALRLSIEEVRVLYSGAPPAEHRRLAARLGPLEDTFSRFLRAQEHLDPLGHDELEALFDACIDPARSSRQMLDVLRRLAPGNGRVGFREVNFLVDTMRRRVAGHLARSEVPLDLVPHDHAFGSGGDFWKTTHATTGACIISAPVLPVCKTGTTNVTSAHGSLQITRKLGYLEAAPDASRLNRLLSEFGFAFVPLQALGLPYSEPLRVARRLLWEEAVSLLASRLGGEPGAPGWQDVMRTTDVPLDIFKIVSPNAQVLHPVHHSTGVCHASMIPYVLGVYLHLGSEGMILHCYDGIDELSTASSDPDGGAPNNVIVWVGGGEVMITEVGPEELGLDRSGLAGLAEEDSVSAGSECLRDVIAGELRGPKRDFLVANSAALLVAGGKVPASPDGVAGQLREGARLAEDLIDSGAARDNFSNLLHALASHG